VKQQDFIACPISSTTKPKYKINIIYIYIKEILNKNKMFQLVFNLAGVGSFLGYWSKII